ncbi:MAG TPA: T9SS type A sorting domain-containing protein [Chitinophagaceae bacterium]|jgi:hypothetical protein|nr:T9SS type A sorting domain-containing protein [Chitinophagaceae bacterium]
MKNVLFVTLLFCFCYSVNATTYYSINNSAPDNTSSWHVNRNGTGASPNNFSGADTFVVQAGHTLITTGNWVLSNKNAWLIIESGATLQADDKISVDNFEIDNEGTYIHNVKNASFPGTNERQLAANSTVEIQNWGNGKLPAPTTWGNLVINMPDYNNNWNQNGSLTDIAGSLIIKATGKSNKEFQLAGKQDYSLHIGGDLIIEDGILETSQANGNAQQVIIIGGSLLQSGGVFTRSNNKGDALIIEFDGASSNFEQTGGTITNTYIDWQVNTAKLLTFKSDLPVADGRSLTILGTLNCANYSVTGAGSFASEAGSEIITANTQGINGSIAVTGSAIFDNENSYRFQAQTDTPFPGNATTITAKDIIVDANVSLNTNLIVQGSLTLNSGILSIPAGKMLTVNTGSAIQGNGFGNEKHIATLVNTSTGERSFLRIKNFSGNTLFPVGNSTYYLPVKLNASGSNDFSVCVFQGATQNGMPDGQAVSSTAKLSMVDADWIVTKNSGAASADMQISWPADLEGSQFRTFNDNQIGITHFDGTAWDSPIGSGNQSMNTATRTAIASFSPFGVGKVDVVLPLTFSNSKAYQKNNNVWVEWTALTEVNVDHYEVERSADGRNFTTIGKTNAKGTGTVQVTYSWVDNQPADGALYYRIKSVDKDGKISYSEILRVDFKGAADFNPRFVLYPNPVIGSNLSLLVANAQPGDYQVFLFDRGGRSLYTKMIRHQGGNITELISLPSSLAQGIYSIRVTGKDLNLVRSFLVK